MVLVNKKRTLVCQVLLTIACVGLNTLCTAREPPKTRTPPVEPSALLIDTSVFPEGWHLWRGPQAIPEREQGERESYYVTFRYEGLEPGVVGARHEALRYRNELEAADSFSKHGFLNRHVITPWAVPDEWSYESPVADRSKFACAEIDILGSYWRCEAVGQYDEFISVLYTLLSPQYMTLEDLEGILVAIDERMAFYLEEDAE